MPAKLPASVPCCVGNSGTVNSAGLGTCGTCPTGVDPPTPLVTPVVPCNPRSCQPLELVLLNGLTPLISEPGVTLLPVVPPPTNLLISPARFADSVSAPGAVSLIMFVAMLATLPRVSDEPGAIPDIASLAMSVALPDIILLPSCPTIPLSCLLKPCILAAPG